MKDLILKHCKPLDPIPTLVEAQLPAMEGIEHLAFDLYGTLLISEPLSRVECEPTLRNLIGGELPDFSLTVHLENLISKAHAHDRRRGVDFPEVQIIQIWAEFFSSLGLPDPQNLQQFILRYELATNPVWPMPGALDLLKDPRSAGIVSNAQFYTPMITDAFGFPSLQHAIYSCNWAKAKPGEFLFQKLACSLPPENTLFIGNDLLKDIAPAAACGFKTALFAGDARSLRVYSHRQDLPKPDAIVTSLDQIPLLLGE